MPYSPYNRSSVLVNEAPSRRDVGAFLALSQLFVEIVRGEVDEEYHRLCGMVAADVQKMHEQQRRMEAHHHSIVFPMRRLAVHPASQPVAPTAPLRKLVAAMLIFLRIIHDELSEEHQEMCRLVEADAHRLRRCLSPVSEPTYAPRLAS